MQMPARTPAMTAMTAMTLDLLSRRPLPPRARRCRARRWSRAGTAQPYGKPLAKTREYVEIVRTILAREKPLEHHGEHYQIPYRGPGATGLGKPLKSIVHPRGRHPDLPRGDRAEERRARARRSPTAGCRSSSRRRAPRDVRRVARRRLREGGRRQDARRRSTSRRPSTRDRRRRRRRAAAASSSRWLALYIGGMGARGKNFYNDLACRYGFEAAAKEIQDLYLDGKKDEADRRRARRARRRGRAVRAEGAHRATGSRAWKESRRSPR